MHSSAPENQLQFTALLELVSDAFRNKQACREKETTSRVSVHLYVSCELSKTLRS